MCVHSANTIALEPVQKAPRSSWLEQSTTEIRPSQSGMQLPAVESRFTVRPETSQASTTHSDTSDDSDTSGESPVVSCASAMRPVRSVPDAQLLHSSSGDPACESLMGRDAQGARNSGSLPLSDQEHMNQFYERPRGSLDYLNDTLNSLAKYV